MIREATKSDAEKVAHLGGLFYEEAGLMERFGGFDPSTVIHLVEQSQGNGSLIALLAEESGEAVGIAMAVLYPFPFNNAVKVGQELFWWVRPEHRKQSHGRDLMEGLEDWARNQGAQAFTMINLHGLDHEAVAKIYKKSGYSPLEHTFTKRF